MNNRKAPPYHESEDTGLSRYRFIYAVVFISSWLMTYPLCGQSFLTKVWLEKAEENLEAIRGSQKNYGNIITEELRDIHGINMFRLADLSELLEEWESIITFSNGLGNEIVLFRDFPQL